MPRRIAKFASAVFVTILTGVPLATMVHGQTATAEDCLSAPKSETPQGGHWRYRIDHVSKRHCWYLRREGSSISQALPQNNPPAPSPSAKPSIADAHAELRSLPAHEDSPVVDPPGNSVANETAPANASVWNGTAAMTTRWPELPAASAVPEAAPVTADPANNVTQAPAEQPEAAAPTTSPSLADFLYVAVQPETIPTLIAAALGALAFAGIVALIFSRGRSRRLRRREARYTRGATWDTTDDDRIILSDHPSAGNRNYRPRFASGVEGAAISVARTPEFARRRARPVPR